MDYRHLIKGMTWSVSRLKTFEQCPYAWYLRYLLFPGEAETDKFYTSYGSFIHQLLEGYYSGSIKKEGLLDGFLFGFRREVLGRRPKAEIVTKYIESGVSYWQGFQPLPWETLAVEKRLNFTVHGLPFIGVIDHLGRDESGLIITDHKSRELLPRSCRAKPTQKDKELDEMLRQLYLYAAAVKQLYGTFPSKLCFNCFRNRKLIIEPFRMEAYEEALEWAYGTVESIMGMREFKPNENAFFCSWLCGCSDRCRYHLQTLSSMPR